MFGFCIFTNVCSIDRLKISLSKNRFLSFQFKFQQFPGRIPVFRSQFRSILVCIFSFSRSQIHTFRIDVFYSTCVLRFCYWVFSFICLSFRRRRKIEKRFISKTNTIINSISSRCAACTKMQHKNGDDEIVAVAAIRLMRIQAKTKYVYKINRSRAMCA